MDVVIIVIVALTNIDGNAIVCSSGRRWVQAFTMVRHNRDDKNVWYMTSVLGKALAICYDTQLGLPDQGCENKYLKINIP